MKLTQPQLEEIQVPLRKLSSRGTAVEAEVAEIQTKMTLVATMIVQRQRVAAAETVILMVVHRALPIIKTRESTTIT